MVSATLPCAALPSGLPSLVAMRCAAPRQPPGWNSLGASAAVAVADRDEAHIGEAVERRRCRTSCRRPALAIFVEHGLGAVAGHDSGDHVAARAERARRAGAARRAPHRRMRLLVRSRPDVDAAVL